MNPSDTLRAGVNLLEPVLPGFVFTMREEGIGSGGPFAAGEYVKDDRRMELHFRQSLGLVRYHVGELSIDHESYLRALGVPSGANQYPGFSDEPLDGFRHLKYDLKHFLSEFTHGQPVVLSRVAPEEMARLAAEWERQKAAYEGDDRARHEARAFFRAGAYNRVVELLERVRYPHLLLGSERRMLEVARRRAVV